VMREHGTPPPGQARNEQLVQLENLAELLWRKLAQDVLVPLLVIPILGWSGHAILVPINGYHAVKPANFRVFSGCFGPRTGKRRSIWTPPLVAD